MTYPAPSYPPPGPSWPGAPASATLAYSSITSGRPWLVTAIGVTSIVVAGLSLLGALWTGLMYLPWIMFSSTAISAVPAGGATIGGTTTPANTIVQADADAIAAAMATRLPLSAADQATLSQALQLAETPLAPPPDGQWTAARVMQQLSMTSSWSDGTTSTATFNFTSGGDITISGGSATVNVWKPNGDRVSTTVSNGVATGGIPVNFGAQTPFSSGFGRWIIIVIVASFGLSLALAVLLLVAGIQTLRSSPAGRSLHLWWAVPKLGAAFLSAYASYVYWNEMLGLGVAGAGGTDMVTWFFTLLPLAFGLAWPITVLVLFLRARSLREFYGEPEAAPAMMASVA